ncbi:class I adenylate-forming enzyme family protein [Leucobacter denitrificans]|uniref:Acyl--CoA ligase n=1 Tax=Leucobacter denitrificans TaxID=683042 RepID=A0A7G9S2A9_9MICO|nr:class I adenylate-forming enzyme family protein [Leucobacter denitrificans]QNN61984.1 acyl--CoA ligase [Leucobacter denitrificans]
MRASTDQERYYSELSAIAHATPDAIAFIDGEDHVTYSEMRETVEDRAAQLRSGGLQAGGRVAIIAENSANFIMTAIAVWVARGVLVTIYPSIPQKDLESTLADSDPVLVLSDTGTEDLVRGAVREGLPITLIDTADFVVESVATDVAPTPTDLREPLSLICYSSGTTSRPKAIMLSARALYNGARVYADVWGLQSHDVTLVSLPMAWLYGLDTSSMSTLLVGGTVVSLRRSRPELIAEAIERRRVTIFPTVTTVLGKLARFLDSDERRWDLSSLRLIVSGGEPRNEQAFNLLRKYTSIPVHDTYCPSESFPLITYDPRLDPEPKQGSAGRIVPNALMRVVDAEGRDVAPGETGEALASGPGLMLGYWNDPELTAESLTDDGWYKTKDLVRVDSDGYVYVVGRLSDMIIRGGSNVSPGEVESTLREHNSVLEAAVVGVPDPEYGEEVVAVIQLADGADIADEELEAFVTERLARFKVPSRFVRVDELPLNSTTQKINRSKVRQMLQEGVRS